MSTGPKLSVRAADARQRQQVGDQRLHPLGAVDGEADVLPRLVVELRSVLALEQLAEVGDLAQRFGQVVRGDVGELLEVGVRAGQLGARRLDLAQGVGRRPAHPLDIAPHPLELRRPVGLDDRVRRSLGDGPGLPGQVVDRRQHPPVHRPPDQQSSDQQQPGGDRQNDDQVVDGVAPLVAGPHQLALDAGHQRGRADADRVEARFVGQTVDRAPSAAGSWPSASLISGSAV